MLRNEDFFLFRMQGLLLALSLAALWLTHFLSHHLEYSIINKSIQPVRAPSHDMT